MTELRVLPPSFPRTRESSDLGMDSGSPFHSVRNDGTGGCFLRHSRARATPATTAWIPGLRFTPPGMTELGLYPRHSRARGNPATSAWIPGLRFTPPGMTELGYLLRHSRERANPATTAWIPGLRFTPPGMTGLGVPPPSFPRTRESSNHGVDSGSPFHSVRNDGIGATPPTSFPRMRESSNHGMDSRSPFPSARNSGMRATLNQPRYDSTPRA